MFLKWLKLMFDVFKYFQVLVIVCTLNISLASFWILNSFKKPVHSTLINCLQFKTWYTDKIVVHYQCFFNMAVD